MIRQISTTLRRHRSGNHQLACPLGTMSAFAQAVCAVAVTILYPAPALAQQRLTLDAPFSDHAVIQRGQPIVIRGQAAPEARISVELATMTQTAQADARGQWRASFAPLAAATNLSIVAKSGDETATAIDVAIGDVFLCSGQSNMQFPLSQAAWNPMNKPRPVDSSLHLLSVPRGQSRLPRATFDQPPSWQSAKAAAQKFSAICFLTGREIATRQKVEVGLIDSSWGGTPIEAWLPASGMASAGLLAQAAMLDSFRNEPVAAEARFGAELDAKWNRSWEAGGPMGYANLYNGMIAPLRDFGLAGAIWYQGETNAHHADTVALYRAKLSALLTTWRHQFRADLPFVIIQIAGFGQLAAAPDDSPSAQVREAQRQVAGAQPHTALVVTTDVSERLDIHPPLKLPVAQRVALALRGLVYGEKISIGPEFSAARKLGSAVQIDIRSATGKLIAASWGRPGPFMLCAGSTCTYADAEFADGGIRVPIGKGPIPDTIRYCYAAAPICNVFDGAGLPLGPFSARIGHADHPSGQP